MYQVELTVQAAHTAHVVHATCCAAQGAWVHFRCALCSTGCLGAWVHLRIVGSATAPHLQLGLDWVQRCLEAGRWRVATPPGALQMENQEPKVPHLRAHRHERLADVAADVAAAKPQLQAAQLPHRVKLRSRGGEGGELHVADAIQSDAQAR